MEQRIRQIRQEIHAIAELRPIASSYATVRSFNQFDEYVKLAQVKLLSSRMWLGKVLKELGTSNPYPESRNPDSSAIEPTADISTEKAEYPDETVAFIKTIRKNLEALEIEMKPYAYTMRLNGWAAWHISTAIEHLMEASMWYGMALSELR